MQYSLDINIQLKGGMLDPEAAAIKQSLENGEGVMISGFEKFCVDEKSERKGRNPQTGESITLAPRRVSRSSVPGI